MALLLTKDTEKIITLSDNVNYFDWASIMQPILNYVYNTIKQDKMENNFCNIIISIAKLAGM